LVFIVISFRCANTNLSTFKGDRMLVRIHDYISTHIRKNTTYHRPWDVSAGIVIAQEAGAIVTGSAPSFASALSSFNSTPQDETSPSKLSNDTAPFAVTPDILTGRKYLVVRAIEGEDGETGLMAQNRIVKEFYQCVSDVAVE
jgi:hypothetical protein